MGSSEPRLSHQTLKVLRILIRRPRERLAGSDIAAETGLLSGTLYPILLRLEKAGWLESDWEEIEPVQAGRPRKRLYRPTGVGYRKAREALSELGVPKGALAWSS